MKNKNLHFVLIVLTAFSLLTIKSKAQVCFSTSNYSVTWGTVSVASGDFNGDGFADLAIIDSANDNVSVKLNNGTGGFGLSTIFSVDNTPVSVISADFNNDGFADIATANYHSDNISVLFGDGLGGFSAAVNFAVGTTPITIIASDFNKDGKADLAVVNKSSQNVSVLIGNGLGSFTKTNFFVGGLLKGLISTDLNNDTYPDLVVPDSFAKIWVMLGIGNGSFGTPTSIAVSGVSPVSVTSGDFNEDGKTDLAISPSNGSIILKFGNGAGLFPTGSVISAGAFGSFISGDFNGDGHLDIVSDGFMSHLYIWLGDGLGNFTGSNYTLAPASFIGADFNNDLKTDLAVVDYYSTNVTVLLNNPLTGITANATEDTVCAGATITLSGGGATIYSWTGGVNDGVAFHAPSLTTSYTVTGTTAGCSNTAAITIVVNPLPTAILTTQDESSSLYCDGTIKAVLSGGTGTIQPQWLNDAQNIISSTDSIGGICPGVYTLNLIDSNLCANTYTQAVLAGPLPPTTSICLVTVDSTYTHNLLIWEKTNLDLTSIDSFIVYREITTNNYQPIGSVSVDSLSTFDDFSANPATTGYRYKLKSKNNMGVLSLFGDYHNTIYLTNNGANFSWTPYQIQNNTTPVSTYNVYRDDLSSGNFHLIGNTTGNQFGYTDGQFSSFPFASYYVEAVMSAGACQPTRSGFTTSRSNVKFFGSTGIQQLNNQQPISIFPNPAGNTLNITGITGKTTLQLFNLVGKLVFEKEVDNNTAINTSLMAEGVYTLLTENKMGRTYNKVVISR